ncbi:hypothetical protein OSTOST_14001 [Ostertagia ostertagi]
MGYRLLPCDTTCHACTQLAMADLLRLRATTHHCCPLCYLFVPESLHYLAIERQENEIDVWLKKAGRCHNNVADIDPSTVISTRQEEPKYPTYSSKYGSTKGFCSI